MCICHFVSCLSQDETQFDVWYIHFIINIFLDFLLNVFTALKGSHFYMFIWNLID